MPEPLMTRRTSEQWLAYFQGNVQSAKDMPWESPTDVTDEQHKTLVASMRAFQKGEGSEGHNLYRFAKDHALAINDPAYVTSIEYFIREEQKHSEFLRLFLEKMNVKPINKTWTDSAFRSMRKYAGLEVSIAVLLTAEMMATVYYPALHRATSSELLKKICARIYEDESVHIHFQYQRLETIRAKRLWIGKMTTAALEYFLYFGTVLVVWAAYREGIRAGGFSFVRYWKTIWNHYGLVRKGLPLPALENI